jgi:hypothetical protein
MRIVHFTGTFPHRSSLKSSARAAAAAACSGTSVDAVLRDEDSDDLFNVPLAKVRAVTTRNPVAVVTKQR